MPKRGFVTNPLSVLACRSVGDISVPCFFHVAETPNPLDLYQVPMLSYSARERGIV